MLTTSSELEVIKRIPTSHRLKKKKKKTMNRKAAAATSVTSTVNAPSESSTSESWNVTTFENNVEKLEEDPRQSSLIHEYLHLTVVTALQVGLLDLVRERPPDPLGFLAAFLLKYKKEHTDEDST